MDAIIKENQQPEREIVERRCPCCHRWNRITITDDREQGKEVWYCHGCGGEKVYWVW